MKTPDTTAPPAISNHVFVAIDHVQLAMPPGKEAVARKFYGEVLGMTELAKPAELAKRGGCWFESGGVQIHLGVEQDFRPAKKAHPAFRCTDYDGLRFPAPQPRNRHRRTGRHPRPSARPLS